LSCLHVNSDVDQVLGAAGSGETVAGEDRELGIKGVEAVEVDEAVNHVYKKLGIEIFAPWLGDIAPLRLASSGS
jgi:hypothetical protein